MSTQTKVNGSDVAIGRRDQSELPVRYGFDIWPEFAQARRLMRHLFGGATPLDWTTSMTPFQIPHLDMYEKDGKTIIECPLAGFRKEDIKLYVEGDRLTISAQQSEQRDRENANYIYRELRRGQFRRTIPLPGPVEPSKVDAKFESGMLRISIPNTSKLSGKQIDIRS